MSRFDHRLWVPIAVVCAPTPVQATQYLTVEQAQKALFPDADAFVATPVRVKPELRAWAASRGGVLLGHIMVDEVIGKHELITYALGVGADGAVRNVEIMDYREARGGEVRDPRWRAQFKGKRSDSPLRLEEDIQNLSGATLSCRHITEGVRRLLAIHAALKK
jgi:Na+-translocating ferredoxin:NAD+ oxidoreductase RnfG subunit